MPKRVPIGYVPLRGTQSFVGVMSQIWNRPSLTGCELAWRWLVGLLMLIPVWLHSGSSWLNHFDELRYEATIALHGGFIYSVHWAILVPSALAAILLWNLIAAIGRNLVLRRLDITLHTRLFALFLFGSLRSLLLAATWLLWLSGLIYAAKTTITVPSAQGEEPNFVLFAAMLIVATLTLYVLWAAISWPLHLAPLLAMRNDTGALPSLRAAFTAPRGLRGKLIETNLVLCIVRIALIVLAIVLSASPLAFQTVATQQFFIAWWAIAVLLYLAASDYFHVVRSAAYLTLHRACVSSAAS